MSEPGAQHFELVPHPATRGTAVAAIGGQVARVPQGLLLRYVIEGDLDMLRIPSPEPVRVADELWRHTCCEAFVAVEGHAAYVEFNFSPSGAWALYAFEGTRQRAAEFLASNDMNPNITVCRTGNKLELDALIRLAGLAPTYAAAALTLGLSAVIEDRHGGLSYWALRHPSPAPDFHHPDGFSLTLDEIRH